MTNAEKTGDQYQDEAFDEQDLSETELLRCTFTRCRFVGTNLSEAHTWDCQFEE